MKRGSREAFLKDTGTDSIFMQYLRSGAIFVRYQAETSQKKEFGNGLHEPSLKRKCAPKSDGGICFTNPALQEMINRLSPGPSISSNSTDYLPGSNLQSPGAFSTIALRFKLFKTFPLQPRYSLNPTLIHTRQPRIVKYSSTSKMYWPLLTFLYYLC